MVPSRHLGLIPAAERSTEAVAAVAAMSTEMTVSLDIPAIVDAAATRARLTATRGRRRTPRTSRGVR